MSKQAQAVIMLLFGGAILKGLAVGSLPALCQAGSAAVPDRCRRAASRGGRADPWYDLRGNSTDDGHGHAHEPQVGWPLLLPVLGLLLVAPPALGSYAAGQAGTVLAAPALESDYPALPPGDPVDVGLLDYASRAVFDDGRSLTGRTLRLTGFVTPGADGQLMLARMGTVLRRP